MHGWWALTCPAPALPFFASRFSRDSVTSGLFTLSIALPLALLVVALLCRAAGSGRLKRNGFAGIRLSSTMANEDAWRRGHRAAERPAWLGFIVALVAAAVGWLARSSPTAVDVSVAVVCVAFVAAFIWSVAAAVRAARSAGF